jgi:peptide deformylase
VAVKPIVLYPGRVLKGRAEPVGSGGGSPLALAQDLVDTMNDAPGCIGLAAPQIGVPLRAFCLDLTRMRKPHDNHGLVVLFDPELLLTEGSEVRREGCASVPDFTCDIRRATRVVVRGTNPEGESRVIEANGFEARALQHEVDHLDGLLILDRVVSAKTDVFRRKRYR